MTPSGLSNSIDDQAALWAVEAAYSEPSPERRAELEAWLALDPRHRGAYVRVRAALHLIEEAVVQTPSGDQSNQSMTQSENANSNKIAAQHTEPAPLTGRRLFSKRNRRTVACGAALAASVAALMVWTRPAPAPINLATPAAETVLRLADGSVATLRYNAKIAVLLSGNSRRITLLNGEARFEVAKDKTRPFVVRSGDVYAQATGTIYSVKRVGSTGGTVQVARGSVLVWSRDERDQAVLLHAGDAVTLDLGSPRPSRAPAAPPLPPPALAQISLDNVSISSAVARFNHVNSTKIVIADRAIGETRIVGLFHADDLEQFAQAAAIVSGGKVAHGKNEIVIKSK